MRESAKILWEKRQFVSRAAGLLISRGGVRELGIPGFGKFATPRGQTARKSGLIIVQESHKAGSSNCAVKG